MRKLSLFVGVTLFAMAGSARAQDEAPADEPAAPADTEEATPSPASETATAAPESKMQVGVAFLPMLMGKGTGGPSDDTSTADLSFAYGVGLSFGYNVIPGLSVGIAPQLLLNVKSKESGATAEKEWDILARIAYAYRVIPQLAIYAEILPGYAFSGAEISVTTMNGPAKSSHPKGFVIAGGLGAAYDVTDLIFVNLGVGYQLGFQSMAVPNEDPSKPDVDYAAKTRFLRVAIGGGVKL
jgi:opacity protein-like surface antigen